MKIVITGGTGFIGQAVVSRLLRDGHSVVSVMRRLPPDPEKPASEEKFCFTPISWDADWTKAIDGADAVINLAGEPIAARRWSKSQKTRIEQSRLEATNRIVEIIGKALNKPAVLISGSAVGYYGDVPEGSITEEHPPADDFLGTVCQKWERSAGAVEQYGLRVVLLRMGIVLEKDGGALAKMAAPFRFLAGGPLGTGRQWISWIHRDDVVRAILFALSNCSISGPINLSAPYPVTMNEFAAELGNILHRPSWARVPEWILNIMLGEMVLLITAGQRVIPKKLLDAGFSFTYDHVHEALRSIFRNSRNS